MILTRKINCRESRIRLSRALKTCERDIARARHYRLEEKKRKKEKRCSPHKERLDRRRAPSTFTPRRYRTCN
ncbi:hypothetical protein PUN28_006622 [Cardiocondyla obscurior]|uniref:Uncharacterized protein n=1 Tax=Cardiocondyla obscurior TaxID=286306 RepID=A0AAW2GFM0_9HYME